ncbi:MAG TPA: methyltransferase domain-containing protein [Nocardioidaceae bacterium]|nr:methyltransferase domain-containing protein [Nocardioidaceae bacterium]
MLDVAPSRVTSRRIEKLAMESGSPYLSLDFDPAADKRQVRIQASLTQLPLPDSSVGVAICFHVLEHVPDDASAMQELVRVLKPGGVAVVQVPRRHGVATEEDVQASPEERAVRFGQSDHVRFYGDDFEERLNAAGLTVQVVRVRDLYDDFSISLLGLMEEETIWLCTKTEPVDVELLRTTSRRSSIAHLHTTLNRASTWNGRVKLRHFRESVHRLIHGAP